MSEDEFDAASAAADTSQWVVVSTRFGDILDILPDDPTDPFIQMLKAQREHIRRKHDEIKASIPEGLSQRQRQEYIAARVMGSVFSDVATETGEQP